MIPLQQVQGQRLTTAERFGPTIQGEGPSLGRPAIFLRLGGCNLHCVWCDTPYTWDWKNYNPRKELKQTPVDDLVDWVHAIHDSTQTRLLVITGGEPLLQDRYIANFLSYLYSTEWFQDAWQVEVETNGTIIPEASASFVSRFNVSPKLENSGNTAAERYSEQTIQWFADVLQGRAIFKFVVTSPADLEEVDRIVKHHGIRPNRLYIMAEGVIAEDLEARTQQLVSAVIQRGYNLTTRLHVQLWGNRRGV